MPAVGPMVAASPDDPLIQSAQLQNRYNAWSRLSSPAQKILDQLGPTAAFDKMAANFGETEQSLRNRGLNPYSDPRSQAMEMSMVDTSPSATASRLLAGQNQGAANNYQALHQRFDANRAMQAAQLKYDRELAAAQAKTSAEQAAKKMQLVNQGLMDVANSKANQKVNDLTTQLKVQQQGQKQDAAHQKALDSVGSKMASYVNKYQNDVAHAMQYKPFIDKNGGLQQWMASQGYAGAPDPSNAAAVTQWLLSQPDAAQRLGINPHAIDAYRAERGQTLQPQLQQQPGDMGSMNPFDLVSQMVSGPADMMRQALQSTPQQQMTPPQQQAAVPQPQQAPPQQQMAQPGATKYRPVNAQESQQYNNLLSSVKQMPPISVAQLMVQAQQQGAPPEAMADILAASDPARAAEVAQAYQAMTGKPLPQ